MPRLPRSCLFHSCSLSPLAGALSFVMVCLPACAQPVLPDSPPGNTPEQPKGDLGEAAQAAGIAADASEQEQQEKLNALLANLDKADRETAGLRTNIMHVSENFITGLVETRKGTLTLRTDWDAAKDHPSGLPLRRFLVHFTSLQLGQREAPVNTRYIFDGTWLAERLEDEKQFNKWQMVPPGERFDPMDKLQGAAVWLPIGQDTAKLRERYDATVVGQTDYFAGEAMGELLKSVVTNKDGSVQLRLVPKDSEDPTKEIRMWFDAKSFLPRAHAVLDGEGVQVSTLFGAKPNPGDIKPSDFDTTTPPAKDGWDATIRPWREGAGG
ncbi:MAG: hypothetical protein ACI89L_001838 [Phycisphaerales bacterium]|jgi:hypothetical protein